VDPDPYWIRIHYFLWVRIRIGSGFNGFCGSGSGFNGFCGSGSVLDPDSMAFVGPDLYLESGSRGNKIKKKGGTYVRKSVDFRL
jgi:hypothetical protein